MCFFPKLFNTRTRQEEMRVLRQNAATNNSEDIFVEIIAPNDTWQAEPNASDLKPQIGSYDQSFVLTTDQCIYIHSGLLAGVFIVGIIR